MRRLLIDIGNSAIKVLKDSPDLESLARRVPERFDAHGLQTYLQEFGEQCSLAAVSVNPTVSRELELIVSHNAKVKPLELYRSVDFPLQLEIENTQTVGTDRIAAAYAAFAISAGSAGSVIIDIGTATTVDLVTSDGKFLGGTIMAGPQISFETLGKRAKQLPHIDHGELPPIDSVLGKNTVQAITAGTFYGHLGSIKEIAFRLADLAASPVRFYLTGGGATWFANNLDDRFEYWPGLVLAGVSQLVKSRQ